MPVGTTFNATVTRTGLVELAYKKIGVLEEGEALSGNLTNHGVAVLDLLVRELSDREVYIHAQKTATLTLVADQWVYTSSHGLNTDIQRLTGAQYRDATATDYPLTILDRKGYDAIPDKVTNGTPEAVFLTDELTLSRTLYVYPALATVNSHSVVTGTDSNPYKCIRSHTAATTNKPITGDNYLLYWESGGSSPAAWASGTSYTAPQLIRYTYERPLYDFDAATDNPEIPSSQARFLMYALAVDLAPDFNVPVERVQQLRALADEGFEKAFARSMRKVTTDYHHKACYY